MNLKATDSQPFVVLFQGRSGSTYLVEALSQHPLVCCDIERLVSLRKWGASVQLEWVDEHFHSNSAEFRAVGFKTKLDDVLDPIAFHLLLLRRRAKIILLTRKNLAKLVISWLNAERIYAATGDWNLYPPTDPMTPFLLDLSVFDRRLRLVEEGQWRLRRYVQGLKLPTHEIFYEDILQDHDGAFQRVFDFLDIPAISVAGSCQKATDDNLQNVLLNFDSVRDRYRGTKIQPMLEEVIDNGDAPSPD
jgi:hypothetical protein